MAFVERGLQVLKPYGVMATLMPAGVLSMTHAQGWRNHLLEDASVALIATFAELSLFRMATVEVGVLVLGRSRPTEPFYKSMWVGEKRDSTSEALRFLRRTSGQYYGGTKRDRWTLDDVPTAKLSRSPSWRPRPRLLQRELEVISSSAGSLVSDIFTVKQGALPAPRDAFVIGNSQWQNLREEERRWFRRVAENDNIKFGRILPGDMIFFPKTKGLPEIDSEERLREELPNFYSHLASFKAQLSKRRGKQERWWELGEDRKWLREPSKKIVSTYFGQVGSFGLDKDGDHIVVQGYGWVPSWPHARGSNFPEDTILNAYLALLNTFTFFQVLSEFCPPVGGGQLNLSKRFSEKAPLPDLLARALASDGEDPTLTNLAHIGRVIRERGLDLAPRAEAEDLVKSLLGL
jgi:adenine-specific DNA-methyltransferase